MDGLESRQVGRHLNLFKVFLCIAHTDVVTSKYHIIQWISVRKTQHEVANELFSKE